MVKSEDLERYPFTQLILIDHNKEKKIELQNTKYINIGLTAFCNFKFLFKFLNFHQIFHLWIFFVSNFQSWDCLKISDLGTKKKNIYRNSMVL